MYLYRLFIEIFDGSDNAMSIKFKKVALFPIILFLPNLHFWTSGIGKDAILFSCIVIFFYALFEFKKRLWLLVIVMLFSIAIRPHITLVLLFALGLGYIIDGNLKFYQKLFIFLLILSAGIGIIDYVVRFIQIESLEIETLEQFASQRAEDLSKGRTESSVDISSYPVPLKIFTFLYRPFFFDAIGILGLLSSLENLILLLLSVKVFFSNPFKGFRRSNYIVKSMAIFFVISSIMFSLILGNLGIMLRQKNMIIPLLLTFGLWCIYSKTNNKISQGENTNNN